MKKAFCSRRGRTVVRKKRPAWKEIVRDAKQEPELYLKRIRGGQGGE